MFFDVERKTRFHVKRRAVISEAPGGYFGSAGRLFRKRWAVILEGRGGLDGVAWRFGWECGVVLGEMRDVMVLERFFWGGMMFIFLYKYAAKVFLCLFWGKNASFGYLCVFLKILNFAAVILYFVYKQQLKRYNYEKKQSISFAGDTAGIGNGICAYIHVGGIADDKGVRWAHL